MGFLVKLIDLLLLPAFLGIAVAAPLMGTQIFLPLSLYPDVLINLKHWYTKEFGDYLYIEQPNFFMGLMLLEIFFLWPLSLINLYGVLISNNSWWLPTTCLIFGSSLFTSMAAISAEVIWSGKASNKLSMAYLPFLGFGALAILRGLMMSPSTKKTPQSGSMARKKKKA